MAGQDRGPCLSPTGFFVLVLFRVVREELGRHLYSVKGECACLRGEERRAPEVLLLLGEGAQHMLFNFL